MAKNEDVDNHLLVIGYNDEISSVSYIIVYNQSCACLYIYILYD